MGIIYCFTSPSGSKYIGKTVGPLKRRINAHKHDSKRKSLPAFGAAIRKYGIENFTIEILAESIDDREILALLEIEFIASYKASGIKLYNVTDGGDGLPLGYKHSDDTRRKMSLSARSRPALKQDNDAMKEVWRQDGYRENMSSKIKDTWKDDERKMSACLRKSKLTESDVSEILISLREGKTINQLKNQYNVKSLAIIRIANNETWKHIPRL